MVQFLHFWLISSIWFNSFNIFSIFRFESDGSTTQKRRRGRAKAAGERSTSAYPALSLNPRILTKTTSKQFRINVTLFRCKSSPPGWHARPALRRRFTRTMSCTTQLAHTIQSLERSPSTRMCLTFRVRSYLELSLNKKVPILKIWYLIRTKQKSNIFLYPTPWWKKSQKKRCKNRLSTHKLKFKLYKVVNDQRKPVRIPSQTMTHHNTAILWI